MQNPALWWPVSVVRADIMKDHLHGNLGILLRHFLRTNPAEQLMAGFLVQATGHTPFILRVRISAVIADGEALRQSLSCKGAAGLKPCHICKNVIKKNHELTGSLQGYLQDIFFSARFLGSHDGRGHFSVLRRATATKDGPLRGSIQRGGKTGRHCLR